MRFFAKCAAENRHRQLRLEALRDLAQSGPGTNLFEQAVRLVERAPTWRQDRQQGARTLLLALGDGFGEASDHYVTAWAWRLAAASGDAQQRRVTNALENGRDLLRSLAGKSGEEARAQAKLLVAVAEEQPLDVGAAILACIRTTDPAAERVIDDASIRLSADPRALAAALGANVPLPRGVKRPTRSRVSSAAISGSALPSAIGALPNEAAHEEPKKRRRRRRKKKGNGEAPIEEGVETATVDEAAEGDEASVQDQSVPPAVEDAAPAADDDAPVKPKRRSRRKVAAEPVPEQEAPTIAVLPVEELPVVDEEPKAKPKRKRKPKAAGAEADAAAVDGSGPAAEPAPPVEPVVEFTASGMRRVVIDDADDATFSTDGMAAKRGRARSKPKPKPRPKPAAAVPHADGEAPAPAGPVEIPEW